MSDAIRRAARDLCTEDHFAPDALWFCPTCLVLEQRLQPVGEVMKDVLAEAPTITFRRDSPALLGPILPPKPRQHPTYPITMTRAEAMFGLAMAARQHRAWLHPDAPNQTNEDRQ